jgi:hypothetical protein
MKIDPGGTPEGKSVLDPMLPAVLCVTERKEWHAVMPAHHFFGKKRSSNIP